MERFFDLKGNNTRFSTEVIAGITTFFAMSYILFVNPAVLSLTGMPSQAVFLATIVASAVGTLFMGLFANVPYALAPGMGLNAFFTYTVVFALGFKWQEALGLVFICGMINILITVTKVRKMIIMAIPETMQHAMGGGIGVFIAYIGVKNAGFLQFTSDAGSISSVNGQAFNASQTHFKGGIESIVSNGGIVPALVNFSQSGALLALIGLIVVVILLIKNVPGAVLISIIVTTLIGIPMGVTNLHISAANSLGNSISQLSVTFGAAFGPHGMGSLFNSASKLPLVIMTVFAFSFSDTFDTLGTFIGTGRRTGIFSAQDEVSLETGHGFSSKMDKALFADSIATSVGAIFGTSNTTTYVESTAGIGAGGRTGLTSVVVAVLFLLSSLIAPFISVIPTQAIAPALIAVGIMMMGSFKSINWDDLSEAIPAFMASIFMGLCYNISYGIAAGFIMYCLIKTITGKAKEIHPILWIVTILFILDFIVLALI
ncbi:xanthine uracil vitamin C permease [Agrilactobacillus composti DSM 18527 = JCM 14202]|uniref:Xanthine uracil vitamin C permease n=1 Tax=Agrilactobacillus composti DSM 18527 = JCM 14202 TaxID=1423734 RepID=A0A0R1XLE0_9LACO|nr:NCS2 family permease [Agrilactobacillus composti]KRM31055.1 xanthine uracil vitamin C permease [Agrilactobacillus composti DSM 18527 = JCM 14202]